MATHDDVLGQAEETLDRVDAALVRLAEGSYGACSVCGAPIAEDRLSVLPTAERCAAHDALAPAPD